MSLRSEFPVLDRIVLPLAETQAGVGDSLIIDGQRASSARVTLDGIDIRDDYIGESYGVVTSGSREALYRATGIDTDQIVNAAMLALELSSGA